MIFRIKVFSSFSSAHKLNEYRGNCENLHGHNWKVQAEISCSVLDDAGLAMDFHELKQYLNSIIKTLDHKYLNELKPFKNTNPTSENIAKYIFENISKLINKKQVKLESISVWETDTSCATYSQQ